MPHQKRNHFHSDLWFWLTLQNWILDFGRPIVMVIRLYKNDHYKESLPQLNFLIDGDYVVSCGVTDNPSSGVVSSEQAQCWRLFPYGLQCHNTISYAKSKCYYYIYANFIELKIWLNKQHCYK